MRPRPIDDDIVEVTLQPGAQPRLPSHRRRPADLLQSLLHGPPVRRDRPSSRRSAPAPTRSAPSSRAASSPSTACRTIGPRTCRVNVGQGNFDTIRYEYFRERQVGFEAFKSGVITFHEDFTSINWAKGYDFPAVHDGRVKRETIPDKAPRGVQGWWLNTRRDEVQGRADPPGARALPSTSNGPTRTSCSASTSGPVSYFQNSPMAATGMPGPDELALLEPFRGKVAGRRLRRGRPAARSRTARARTARCSARPSSCCRRPAASATATC